MQVPSSDAQIEIFSLLTQHPQVLMLTILAGLWGAIRKFKPSSLTLGLSSKDYGSWSIHIEHNRPNRSAKRKNGLRGGHHPTDRRRKKSASAPASKR
jgi:hypothetical protein